MSLTKPSNYLVGHPLWVLGVFLILTLLLGWQARNFEIDASADTLLTQDNRHYIESRLVSRTFSPDEFILLAYEPLSHSLFSQQTYDDIRAISAELSSFERAKSVQSILSVPLLAPQSGQISVNTDLAAMTLDQGNYSAAEVREIFSGHPLYEDLLVNADQTSTAIQVSFHDDPELTRLQNQITEIQSNALNGSLTDDQQEELRALQEQAEPLEKALTSQRNNEIGQIRSLVSGYSDRANLYLGGTHVLGYQLIQIIQQDLVAFGLAIGLMICLVLLLVFRRPRWVVIPVVSCVASVGITMGLLAMMDIKATVISANFIALQLILTLAIVIHLIVQYRELSRSQPEQSVKELVVATLEAKTAPCFYAGLTTSVGFCSLVLADIQPVISFGYMMILAMAVSILVSLVLFPVLMVLFPQEPEPRRNTFSQAVLGLFSKVSLRHPAFVALGSVGVLVAVGLGILRLDVENSFINYFSESTDVRRELGFIDREFGGSTPLDIVYSYPESEDNLVLTADTVQLMQVVQENLDQREAIGKVLSLVNFTEVARAMNNDRPLTEYELTSIYWLMEESLRESLMGSFVQPDARQVRISARIQDTTPGLDRGNLMASLESDLAELFPEAGSFTLTNLFVLYQDALQKLFKSQIVTLGLVFVVLLVAFALIFRSVGIALVALAPNILTTLAILGVMGWLGIPLDLMTITISAIAMGIAVDDTIHYVHRYRQELRDQSAEDAIRNTHNSIGHAVLYTSIIVALGFSLLSFSDFVPSVYFGLLTGLAMIAALLINLTLLPVMLRHFVGKAD